MNYVLRVGDDTQDMHNIADRSDSDGHCPRLSVDSYTQNILRTFCYEPWILIIIEWSTEDNTIKNAYLT